MMQNIYNALIHYLETNRLANLNIRSGWRQRLQDIYVAYSRQQNSSATGATSKPRQLYGEKK